jgi:hypothetical protein
MRMPCACLREENVMAKKDNKKDKKKDKKGKKK